MMSCMRTWCVSRSPLDLGSQRRTCLSVLPEAKRRHSGEYEMQLNTLLPVCNAKTSSRLIWLSWNWPDTQKNKLHSLMCSSARLSLRPRGGWCDPMMHCTAPHPTRAQKTRLHYDPTESWEESGATHQQIVISTSVRLSIKSPNRQILTRVSPICSVFCFLRGLFGSSISSSSSVGTEEKHHHSVFHRCFTFYIIFYFWMTDLETYLLTKLWAFYPTSHCRTERVSDWLKIVCTKQYISMCLNETLCTHFRPGGIDGNRVDASRVSTATVSGFHFVPLWIPLPQEDGLIQRCREKHGVQTI